MTNSASKKEKILIIRMLELGDVLSIALPAIRHLQDNNPDAEIVCLTYAKGQEIIQLGSPNIKVICLPIGHWPDNIVQAMETFLGLAEDVIEQAFDRIINLDTAFMPCFLSRFLKDAGEPVSGNYLNLSVQDLLQKLQNQTLEADYVNDSENFMKSTFFGMSRLYSRWWEEQALPENGYAEFYLKNCCGFTDIDFDLSIKSSSVAIKSHSRKTVAMATHDPSSKLMLTHVQKSLSEHGVDTVWLDNSLPIVDSLQKLSGSNLLVSTPGAEIWFASAVDCPTLLICGDLDPRFLMPNYATERFVTPKSSDLVESIMSIFSGNSDE